MSIVEEIQPIPRLVLNAQKLNMTTTKNYNNLNNHSQQLQHLHKLNQMKLQPGLGALLHHPTKKCIGYIVQ